MRSCAFQLTFLTAAALFGQDAAVVSRGAKKLPSGYKVYSLFLLPSTNWHDEEIRSLRTTFQDFGDAIGSEKAAIWFTNADDSKPDFVRSKTYCDKFNLNYDDGPYVVTMKSLPENVRQGDSVVIVKLGGISSERVVSVLNVLEQDLRTEKDTKHRALLFEEIKQRLLTVKDRHGSELKEIATLLLKVK
jgi:hypothetical protein